MSTRTRGRRFRLIALAALLCVPACEARRVESGRHDGVEQQGTGGTTARALVAAAESTYARAEYDSAIATLRDALRMAQRESDTLAHARSLTWIGLANWRLGRYDEAQRWGDSAVRLKERARLSSELFRSYNALGLLAHDQGRFGAAIELFDRAEQAARVVGDSLGVAKAIGNRGLPHVGIGEFGLARREFGVLRDMGRDAGHAVAEANALSNIGMVAIRAGNPGAAIEPLSAAVSVARKVGHAVGEENTLGQLGTAYDAMGDPRRALAYLDSALAIARRRGMKREESDDLLLIAAIYTRSGEHARALDFLSRAATISDELGLQDTGGDIARLQARAYFALGDLERARARAQAARRLHAAAGARLEQLGDELMVAELSQRMEAAGRAHDATATGIAAARELARALDLPIARATLALGLARIADAAHDARGVLTAIDGARSEVRAVGSDFAWEASALRARALLALRRYDEAVTAGREAVREIERVRGQFGAGALRSSYTAARADVYGDLVVALLRLGRTEEAFSVADAARGRALLDHIAAVGKAAARPTAADLAQAEELLRRIDTLVRRLRVADSLPMRRRSLAENRELDFLASQLASARRSYEVLVERAASSDPASAVLLGGTMPSASDLRSALGDGEAVLEYLATPKSLIVFVARRDGVQWLDVAVTAQELGTRVRQGRELLARRDTAARPVLRALDELLVEPLRRRELLRGVRTLIIVPHASLAYLPFAALLDRSGRYLVQEHDILMLPSSASVTAIRAREYVETGDAGTVVVTPFPDSLPGTRAEAKAIERLVPGTRSVVGARATETLLRRELGKPGVVHVATHGLLVGDNPMFSRVELMPGPARSARAIGGVLAADDGRLEVHELFGLDVRASLVFLSGCETAAGAAWSTSYARGEDHATLAAALLYAGARNVVATLWRIDDDGAAAFAAAFYGFLSAGPPVRALAEAQRAMMRHAEYASPFYWAAYVVAGDAGRPVRPDRKIAGPWPSHD